ncbi:hypothetical protein [Nocardia sp. NPDC049526]|uniref:hypothetical protein n=1 Tax=Nocardia sp. NPDC049526 TaxID=3364316 RepID=UPI0037B585F6
MAGATDRRAAMQFDNISLWSSYTEQRNLVLSAVKSQNPPFSYYGILSPPQPLP